MEFLKQNRIFGFFLTLINKVSANNLFFSYYIINSSCLLLLYRFGILILKQQVTVFIIIVSFWYFNFKTTIIIENYAIKIIYVFKFELFETIKIGQIDLFKNEY